MKLFQIVASGGFDLAESSLSAGVTFLDSFAIPGDGLSLVVRNTAALRVQLAEIVLGIGVPLVGGLAKPADRLRIIPRNAPAIRVHLGEIVLGGSVSTPGAARMLRKVAASCRSLACVGVATSRAKAGAARQRANTRTEVVFFIGAILVRRRNPRGDTDVMLSRMSEMPRGRGSRESLRGRTDPS